MWSVYVNGHRVKSYTYKIQASIYCFMNGYVYSGWDDFKFGSKSIYVLDDRVEIREEK